jgi:hypothetical protein
MKKTNTFFLSALAVVGGLSAVLPAQAADVGVSVTIGQPGFYGRVDIGQQPPPPVALVYAQPVVIQPAPVAVYQRPIYLRVPPGHQKHWARECRRYNACGQPVYFITDQYYQQHYVQPAPPPPRRDWDRRDDRRDEHRDQRDWHGDDDRGHGKGHDHGHGNGHGRGHDKHGD